MVVMSPAAVEQRRFQSSERFYKCGACAKVFRLPNALTHHILTKHGGEAQVVHCDANGNTIAAEPTVVPPAAPPVAATDAAAPTAATPTAATSPAASAEPLASAASRQAPADAPVATPTPPSTSPSSETAETPDDFAGKKFVCHLCSKPFRLEAALAHHYQAKHGVEMPGAAAGTSVGAADAAASLASDAAAAAEGAAPPAAGGSAAGAPHQTYIASTDVVAPQPPQYHLDAAPNAPEEREIAVHARCVNHVVLVGAAQDITQGYVFEDRVLQFVVTTMFDDPAPGDPDRDFHTVRVFGEELAAAVAEQLRGAGASASSATAGGVKRTVMVSGRLRMIPQYEPTAGRYYHFPVVHVHAGSGNVVCL